MSSNPPECKESAPKPHPVLGARANHSAPDTPLRSLARRVLPSMVFHLSRASWQWLYDQIPDRFVQASKFKRTFGRELNLAAPKRFNEKIQWLMLYHRIPAVTRLADKYEVRSYVAQQVGNWLLNDLFGVWDDPLAVAFDQLPESFVLKVTSGSGKNIFCRDKSRLDVEKTRRQLARWMKRSEYWRAREWCYKNIEPRIICERLLTDEGGAIPSDFKFFCFDGEPLFVQLDTDRFTNHRRDLFDLDWKRLPFSFEYPSSGPNVQRPHNLETMISAARALSRGFPFVRVDLYSILERVVFGEMTWYPEGGLGRFIPDIYDLHLGEALTLPKTSNSGLLRGLSSRVGWPSHS